MGGSITVAIILLFVLLYPAAFISGLIQGKSGSRAYPFRKLIYFGDYVLLPFRTVSPLADQQQTMTPSTLRQRKQVASTATLWKTSEGGCWIAQKSRRGWCSQLCMLTIRPLRRSSAWQQIGNREVPSVSTKQRAVPCMQNFANPASATLLIMQCAGRLCRGQRPVPDRGLRVLRRKARGRRHLACGRRRDGHSGWRR